MFKIALCDDQKQIVLQLADVVKQIFSETSFEYSIDVHYSGDDLLKKDVCYDLIFLDIEMPGLDGIEVGKILSQRYDECKIVMATSIESRYKEAFMINAFRFVTKPFSIEEIKETIFAALELKKDKKSIELYYQRIPCEVLLSDIQYIKAFNGYSEYMVGNRIFRNEKSLSTVEKFLDEDYFVRIHRQYIVNMRWIKKYRNGQIEISDKLIPVSKRKIKEFEQEYIKYDLKYNRRK